MNKTMKAMVAHTLRNKKKKASPKAMQALQQLLTPKGSVSTLQQTAPQVTKPVASRADVIARALDAIQRRQAVDTLMQY